MRAEDIKYLIIHCTATKEGLDFRAKDVDRWHKEKGWVKIGYHYLICLDGTIEKGREDFEEGAHCYGKNKCSIGICYVGGLDSNGKAKDTRTVQQKAALFRLLVELKQKFPNVSIHGHNEFAKKSCPCFDVKKEYGEL